MSNDDLKEIFGTDLEEELEGLVEVVDDANAVCSHIDKWYQEKLDELKQDLDDPRAYLLSLDGTYRDVVLSHTNTLPALRQVVVDSVMKN